MGLIRHRNACSQLRPRARPLICKHGHGCCEAQPDCPAAGRPIPAMPSLFPTDIGTHSVSSQSALSRHTPLEQRAPNDPHGLPIRRARARPNVRAGEAASQSTNSGKHPVEAVLIAASVATVVLWSMPHCCRNDLWEKACARIFGHHGRDPTTSWRPLGISGRPCVRRTAKDRALCGTPSTAKSVERCAHKWAELITHPARQACV